MKSRQAREERKPWIMIDGIQKPSCYLGEKGDECNLSKLAHPESKIQEKGKEVTEL